MTEPKSGYAKYRLRHGEDTPQGRLAAAYDDGEWGKAPLINRTMEAGAILLDCHLQELLIGVSKLTAYIHGDSSQRRALVLAELRNLGGHQESQPAPIIPREPAPAPKAIDAPVTVAEAAPQPTHAPPPPVRAMPAIGASPDEE